MDIAQKISETIQLFFSYCIFRYVILQYYVISRTWATVPTHMECFPSDILWVMWHIHLRYKDSEI